MVRAWVSSGTKARPVGVVVFMGELRPRNPMQRSLNSSMLVLKPAGEALQRVEVEGDEDITAAQVVETDREVRVIGRGAGDAERVELAVEDPTSFGGGATGVADGTHGMCPR